MRLLSRLEYSKMKKNLQTSKKHLKTQMNQKYLTNRKLYDKIYE